MIGCCNNSNTALAWKRDVDALPERLGEAPAPDSLRSPLVRVLEPRAQLVQRLAGLAVADLAQGLRQVGPAPEETDVDVVQLVERGGCLVSRDGFRLVGLPVHAGDCIAWLSHCSGPGLTREDRPRVSAGPRREAEAR